MDTRVHFKQVLLFALTVMLPGVVLIIFTLRMINQEEELSKGRIAEERQRIAREVGQRMLLRLEQIKSQEQNETVRTLQSDGQVTLAIGEVRLVALVDGLKLTFPWEITEKMPRADVSSNSDFQTAIHQAEYTELAVKNYNEAASMYRNILRNATGPFDRGYAKLLLARTLIKSGKNDEAKPLLRDLLNLSFDIQDEYGIPLVLYAAGRLVELGVGNAQIVSRILAELESNMFIPPSVLYMLEDVIDSLETVDQLPAGQLNRCRDLISRKRQLIYLSQELENEFPSLLRLLEPGRESSERYPVWILYGENDSLISLAEPVNPAYRMLIVVDAGQVVSSLMSEDEFKADFPFDFALVGADDEQAETIGSNFENARLAFDQEDLRVHLSRFESGPAFYWMALVLLLGLTFFGAYLFWKDIRRDIKTADMRAQFVSSVSHELKTPLTAIQLYAETLHLDRMKDAGTRAEYLDTIVNESRRLARLLNNVLDFASIEKGRRYYKKEQVSLDEVVRASAQVIEFPFRQHGFRLHVNVDEDVPPVQGDRDALEQAILNLLHNAMKYSADSRDVHLHLAKQNGMAVISVIDHGIGIDASQQKLIFDRFYRISGKDNEHIVGTGLGLFLVNHIVKAHHGFVDINSRKGEGSEFSIHLPPANGE